MSRIRRQGRVASGADSLTQRRPAQCLQRGEASSPTPACSADGICASRCVTRMWTCGSRTNERSAEGDYPEVSNPSENATASFVEELDNAVSATRRPPNRRPWLRGRIHAAGDWNRWSSTILAVARRGASSPRKGPCPPTLVRPLRTFFQPDLCGLSGA